MSRIGVAVLLAVLFSGCVGVDYVGQKFPPRPAGSYVAFFNSRDVVPGGYHMIGRGDIVAPESYTAGDVRELLMEKAEEVGADAVAIGNFKKVLTSVNFVPYEDPEEIVGDWGSPVTSTRVDGTQVYTNTFGQQQSLEAREVKRYRVFIQAEFLVDQERFDKVMAEKRRKREAEHKREVSDKSRTPADVMAAEKKQLDELEARRAASEEQQKDSGDVNQNAGTAAEAAPVTAQ